MSITQIMRMVGNEMLTVVQQDHSGPHFSGVRSYRPPPGGYDEIAALL